MTIRRCTPFGVAILSLVALASAVRVEAQVHFTGTTGPGSLYEIHAPAAWNGDLVIYAHAIVQAEPPVALPAVQDGYAQVRAALLAANPRIWPPHLCGAHVTPPSKSMNWYCRFIR